jgi:integral membrane protein (TIGR01906 family)
MKLLALALFVIGFAVAGLVVFALLWAGEAPYRDMARANGVDRFVFVLRPEGRQETDLETAVALHGEWSRYVTGGTTEPPRPTPALFTDDEYAHMADVRRVFDGARLGVPAGLFVIIVRLQRARAAGAPAMWRLARDGALISLGAVAIVGIVATVAFEPLFLAFHYVFFPQGNFLFDPATSNLIRLYPEWYWEGISLRVGLSFIGLALGVAVVAQLRLRAAK